MTGDPHRIPRPAAAAPDWVEPFYTQKSAWFGPSGILEHHRARADTIARLCGSPPLRVLELGAGAGGSAAATARLGYEVTAVELSPLRAAYARELAAESGPGTVAIAEGDFFTVDLDGPFDVVVYWDGFGVGDDDQQRALLRRIGDVWLRPHGSALIDVFSPWAWARAAGRETVDAELDLVQQLDFDWLACRFVDSWRPTSDPSQVITQSIRCYTVADLELLLDGTGLEIDTVEVAGAALEREREHLVSSPLENAWSYLAKLVRRPRARRAAS